MDWSFKKCRPFSRTRWYFRFSPITSSGHVPKLEKTVKWFTPWVTFDFWVWTVENKSDQTPDRQRSHAQRLYLQSVTAIHVHFRQVMLLRNHRGHFSPILRSQSRSCSSRITFVAKGTAMEPCPRIWRPSELRLIILWSVSITCYPSTPVVFFTRPNPIVLLLSGRLSTIYMRSSHFFLHGLTLLAEMRFIPQSLRQLILRRNQ